MKDAHDGKFAGMPPALVALMDENFPERLAVMASNHYQVLRAAEDLRELSDERIAQLVLQQVDQYSLEEGGGSFYVVKGVHYRLSLRDRRIVAQFTGDNLAQLAAEHKLSEMRVRQILAAAREEYVRRNQGKLFGEDGGDERAAS